MRDDDALLRALIDLEPEWEIHQSKLDPHRRSIDAWVVLRPRRSWWKGTVQSSALDESSWRHLNVGEMKLWIHARYPTGTRLEGLPWAGAEDMPFSHAMTERVFTLLDEGVSLEGICRLLELDIGDLWKYKYALDRGMIDRFGGITPPKITAPGNATAVAALAEPPDASSPIWEKLISRQLQLHDAPVNFRNALERMQSEYSDIRDPEVRALKRRALHRYFSRNANLLGHAIEQLQALRRASS